MVEKFSTTKETVRMLSLAGAKGAKKFVKIYNRRAQRRANKQALRQGIYSMFNRIDYKDVL